MLEKSSGHVAFIGMYEFYERNDDLCRAHISKPIATDGYRCGRWECRINMSSKFFWSFCISQVLTVGDKELTGLTQVKNYIDTLKSKGIIRDESGFEVGRFSKEGSIWIGNIQIVPAK